MVISIVLNLTIADNCGLSQRLASIYDVVGGRPSVRGRVRT